MNNILIVIIKFLKESKKIYRADSIFVLVAMALTKFVCCCLKKLVRPWPTGEVVDDVEDDDEEDDEEFDELQYDS